MVPSMGSPTIASTAADLTGPFRRGRRAAALTIATAMLVWSGGAAGQTPVAAPKDAVTLLVERLEQRAAAGDADGIKAFALPENTGVGDFADSVTTPKPARLVMRERDRRALGERGQRLIVEVFHERDIEARLGTWQLDVQPTDAAGDKWGIAAATRFSVVNGL